MRILKILCAVAAAAILCACASDSQGDKIDLGHLNDTTAENLLSETAVVLSGEVADINGEGAAFDGGILTVSEGGVYRLSGELKGSIIVDIPKSDEAELILCGLSVESNNSAIYVKCADKVTLNLEEGSVNTFVDGENYCIDEDYEPSACIYSADDLELIGKGELLIYAKCRNGIQTKNDLRIKGGSLTVTAPKNALKGKDSVQISGGIINITGAKDGIKSDNETEVGRGVVSITGGNIAIYCQDDGIQAFSKLEISSTAAVKINAGDKSLNCDGEISVADGCLIEE